MILHFVGSLVEFVLLNYMSQSYCDATGSKYLKIMLNPLNEQHGWQTNIIHNTMVQCSFSFRKLLLEDSVKYNDDSACAIDNLAPVKHFQDKTGKIRKRKSTKKLEENRGKTTEKK